MHLEDARPLEAITFTVALLGRFTYSFAYLSGLMNHPDYAFETRQHPLMWPGESTSQVENEIERSVGPGQIPTALHPSSCSSCSSCFP